MTADSTTIGKRIRAYRVQRQMTQATLADRLDVTPVFISYIERGKRGVSLAVLLKIVDEFKISLDSLVLDEVTIPLPNAYKKLMILLADCDIDEYEQIVAIVSDYVKMIRADQA